jgi:calcineurin-like phosphoesterase family protein
MDLVISDTHFAHTNIIKYCNRPFSSADEMDQFMIDAWNKIVRPEDTVYHLGDLAFGKGSLEKLESYLPLLSGKIILIRGNHDRQKADWYLSRGISEVHGGTYYKYAPNVILSHAPYPTKSPMTNIHGHTHNLMMVGPDPTYINVSVEAIGYAPIPMPVGGRIYNGTSNLR